MCTRGAGMYVDIKWMGSGAVTGLPGGNACEPGFIWGKIEEPATVDGL